MSESAKPLRVSERIVRSSGINLSHVVKTKNISKSATLLTMMSEAKRANEAAQCFPKALDEERGV